MPLIYSHLPSKEYGMTGNTTIHHIINDSLMPELSIYQNENIFRGVWREWRELLTRNTLCFLNPLETPLQEIHFSPELCKDWDALSIMAESYSVKPPLGLLFKHFPSQHRYRFFVALLWQTLHIQFYGLIQILQKEDSIPYQQFLLMSYMRDLEQFISDNQQCLSTHKYHSIRKSFQELFSFFWLKIYRLHQELIHSKSLKYFEEEMLEYLINNKTGTPSLLQEYLIQQLRLKPMESMEEFEKTAPEEIIANMNSDLKDIQKDLKTLKLAPSLEMNNDVYLKPKDAAKFLGIAVSTLAKYRTQGRLKKYRKPVPGNWYEYSERELEAFKEKS